MNDAVNRGLFSYGLDGKGAELVGLRQLDTNALRFMRMLVDTERRCRYLADQVERYVCEHGHVPTYGQLEEFLSFEVDGETTRLFSRSTIRWAILRWKRQECSKRSAAAARVCERSTSRRATTTGAEADYEGADGLLCRMTQNVTLR